MHSHQECYQYVGHMSVMNAFMLPIVAIVAYRYLNAMGNSFGKWIATLKGLTRRMDVVLVWMESFMYLMQGMIAYSHFIPMVHWFVNGEVEVVVMVISILRRVLV